MLRLAEPTRSDWFADIAADLDTILVDHAHLEKRAASTALNMLFHYTGYSGVARLLSEVVQEEMEHFTRMLDLLEDRGVELVRQRPSPYAGMLVQEIARDEPKRFLDRLLVAALIEARSCERFSVLAANVGDLELATFYEELFESEARHYTLYTGLARDHFPEDEVEDRLQALSLIEVEALKAGRGMARLHSY